MFLIDLLEKKGNRERACRTEFCDHGWNLRNTGRVKTDVKKKKSKDPRITGGLGRKDAKGEAEVCAKQLGAGELMAQSASCSWSCACPAVCWAAPACALQRCAEGHEIKAHIKEQVDGEGPNGLTVDIRSDTWPAPQRHRNSLVLGAPSRTADFPFLTSAKRFFLCVF